MRPTLSGGRVTHRIVDRLHRWHARLLRHRARLLRSGRQDAGFALWMALATALLLMVGAAIVSTRSLSAWLSRTSEAQLATARDAAEFGFAELVGQLNQPQNSFLLVTKFANWQTVTYDDLNQCGIGVPDAASVTANTVKTAAAGTQFAVADSNERLKYSLQAFTPPLLAGTTSQAAGPCKGDVVAKFGNLAGGSAILTVTGQAFHADGSVAATHVLRRSVTVEAPDENALANPILLMAKGSKLYGLNGNICQGSATDTSCTGKPLTIVSCVDLADCIDNNLKTDKTLSIYCSTSKKFKRNTICNTYQQSPLLAELPPYPSITNTTYYGPNINDLGDNLQNAEIENCKANTKGPPKCKYIIKGKKGTTPFKLDETKNYYFPYQTESPPTSTSPLLPMCTETIDNGGSITCRIDKLTHHPGNKQAPFVIYTRSAPPSAPTTGVSKSVNLLVGAGGKDSYGEIELDKGIVNNVMTDFPDEAPTAWKTMRVFSRGFTTTIDKACSTEIPLKIDDKRPFGIDGAFLWLPDAKMKFSKKDRSGSYFVAWVCQLDGDKKDPTPSTLVTPLQNKDILSGLSNLFAGSGSPAVGGYYRARGSNTTQ